MLRVRPPRTQSDRLHRRSYNRDSRPIWVTTRRLSCLGCRLHPPTPDVWLRRSEPTLRANRRQPTMPLTCIRKRSTDGLRCEGTWACAWGRSKDRLGYQGLNVIIHSWVGNGAPNRKFASDSRVNSRSQSTPTRRHRTGLSREQMSLWLAGYQKTPGFRRPVRVQKPTMPNPAPQAITSHTSPSSYSVAELTRAKCQNVFQTPLK